MAAEQAETRDSRCLWLITAQAPRRSIMAQGQSVATTVRPGDSHQGVAWRGTTAGSRNRPDAAASRLRHGKWQLLMGNGCNLPRPGACPAVLARPEKSDPGWRSPSHHSPGKHVCGPAGTGAAEVTVPGFSSLPHRPVAAGRYVLWRVPCWFQEFPVCRWPAS